MFTFSFLNTGVQKYDMFLVNYSVPLKESTFTCRIFDLPVKTDYHVIASKPINYQHKLLGQVAVYGCSKCMVRSFSSLCVEFFSRMHFAAY